MSVSPVPVTRAETQRARRAAAKNAGRCGICIGRPARRGLKTCAICSARSRPKRGVTAHSCTFRGGLGRIEPRCPRCREIAADLAA